MKKSLLAIASLAVAGLTMSACSIGELKPEPIPLATADSSHFTIDNSAISDSGAICGEKYSAFQNTLRNGFNVAANAGENSSVVAADRVESRLTIKSIDMSCIGKDKLDGYIINARVIFSWTIDKGPETTWPVDVIGAGSSAEKALGNLVTDIYNVAFSTYITNYSK